MERLLLDEGLLAAGASAALPVSAHAAQPALANVHVDAEFYCLFAARARKCAIAIKKEPRCRSRVGYDDEAPFMIQLGSGSGSNSPAPADPAYIAMGRTFQAQPHNRPAARANLCPALTNAKQR
jgi:hypothetical protein